MPLHWIHHLHRSIWTETMAFWIRNGKFLISLHQCIAITIQIQLKILCIFATAILSSSTIIWCKGLTLLLCVGCFRSRPLFVHSVPHLHFSISWLHIARYSNACTQLSSFVDRKKSAYSAHFLAVLLLSLLLLSSLLLSFLTCRLISFPGSRFSFLHSRLTPVLHPRLTEPATWIRASWNHWMLIIQVHFVAHMTQLVPPNGQPPLYIRNNDHQAISSNRRTNTTKLFPFHFMKINCNA